LTKYFFTFTLFCILYFELKTPLFDPDNPKVCSLFISQVAKLVQLEIFKRNKVHKSAK